MPITKNRTRATTIGALAIVLACLACFVPLIAPSLLALSGAGVVALAFAGFWQIGVAVLVAVLAALGFVYWRRLQRNRPSQAAENQDRPTELGGSSGPAFVDRCGCAADSGCNAGESCDLPSPEANAEVIGYQPPDPR